MQHREQYDSDVSDREWTIIRQFLPQRGRLGRPPRYERKEVFNAIMYVTKDGLPWRYLPHDFPGWRLVYYYFASWQRLGVFGSASTMPFGKRCVSTCEQITKCRVAAGFLAWPRREGSWQYPQRCCRCFASPCGLLSAGCLASLGCPARETQAKSKKTRNPMGARKKGSLAALPA